VHNGDANGLDFARPWEECRGIAGSFGYNRNENLEDYSSSEQLVHMLINKVARGGNLLLNIGPTADGRIPVIMQQRLTDIGSWLKVNGEAIYSTRKWAKAPKVTPTTKQYFTQKGNDLYLITTEFPKTALQISGLKKPISVSLLGSDVAVRSTFKNGVLSISPPAITPGNNPSNYAWAFKLTGATL
jgi:alpha-L-fucosidase